MSTSRWYRRASVRRRMRWDLAASDESATRRHGGRPDAVAAVLLGFVGRVAQEYGRGRVGSRLVMSTPQQPELARSRRTASDPSSAKLAARTDLPSEDGDLGPMPEANLPGHHPPEEQDKPSGPPKLPPRHHRFAFRRDPQLALASRVVGVTEDNAFVDVDDERLLIRFGPWQLETPMGNVIGAERTGPYRWWKVVGPPRLSMRDFGITFATTTAEGVCLRFRDPVPAALPRGPLRHKGATVTVEDPDDLVHFVEQTRARRDRESRS